MLSRIICNYTGLESAISPDKFHYNLFSKMFVVKILRIEQNSQIFTL